MRDAIIGYGVLFILLAFFLGLIPLVIYNRFRPDNKLQKKINAFFASKQFKGFTNLIVACFFLLMGAVYVNLYFTESGWFPRTREVSVYVNAFTWVTGEMKTCYSSETAEKGELTFLSCDSGASQDIHLLRVKFWGTITTEKNKVYKCGREESSLTCKLQ